MVLYDLTNMQKSIWFTEQFYKNTPISNIVGTAMIYEKVNIKILMQAINLFIEKNDSLRIKLVISNGIPKQYVADYSSSFTFDLISVFNDKDVKELEKELSLRIFNMNDSFLFNFKLFQFPDGHGGFVVCIHHLISDAWTLGLLVSEIMDFYSSLLKGKTPLADKMPSYVDTIIDEQDYLDSKKFEKDRLFWNNMFETVPEIATIPGTISSAKISSIAKRKQFTFPKETIALINNFCKENKVSIFNFFMGVLSIYISRVSSLNEFVIGTPILNRTNFKEKHTTGMFINVVPFKININHENSFIEFVCKISSDFFNIFKHQKYPYQNLLSDLREKDNSIPNLFNIMYSYQNMRSNKQSLEVPYDSKWIFSNNISNDIEIHLYDVNDTGNLIMAYDFKTVKYCLDDIFALHSRILHIINQILTKPLILLKDIEIVIPEEKNKILYEFNNTKMDYPKDKTIIQLFEEQVEKTPDNIAVVFEDEQLSYKELNERANSLAYHLIENGVCKNNVVGIMLNRSLELVVSILAILKAGAAYMLINSTLPDERISYMIKNSKCSLIISHNSISSLHNCQLFDCNILNFPSTTSYISNLNIHDSNYLSVIYTSGSTGTPKGVLIKIDSMVNLLWGYVHYIHASSYNKFLSVCNISFDMFSVEVLLPLILGKSLFLANEEEQKDPIPMSNLITKNKIEYMLSTPSKLELLFLNEQAYKSLAYIKSLQIGGENPSLPFLKKLSQFTNAKIYNAYGPTETTSCCSIKEIVNINEITIGKPLGNVQIYVLNKFMKLCPIGVVGEICIAGNGISAGYINNKDLTEKAFINNPFNNGLLYKTGDLGYYTKNYELKFVGRNDSQIKINGLRIELSEIDSVITAFPNIEKVATIYAKKRLITYFKASTKIDLSSLKDFAKSKLPAYMVPSSFIQLEEFPLSTNGKLDVKMLFNIQPIIENTTIVHPRNNTEQQIFDIFASILQTNDFSVIDDFFELGGDSLAAIKLSVELYNILNVKISIKEIFENSSVSKIALLLDKTEKETSTLIPRLEKRESYPLSSAQRRIYYSYNLSGENFILYNMPGGVILDKLPDIKKLENCLNILIDRHEALRTYFVLEKDTVVQKIQDKITFKLEVSQNIVPTNNLEIEFHNFVRPFDLSQTPLIRVKLINLQNGKVALFVDMHHIISDGTSMKLFIDELCKLYNGDSLKDINITYKDFAVWEQENLSSETFKKAEDFWVNQFKDDIPVLNMPTTFPRPALKSYEGAKFKYYFDESITRKINDISKKYDLTPYMLLLSCYYILLSKYSAQEDIIVGTPIVGRNVSETYDILGMFINTLPIRINIDYSKPFKDFLKNVKDICLKSYEYQYYPFDELVSKLDINRDVSRDPLFDTMFIYQNNGNPSVNFDEIKAEYYTPDTKISKFDLSLEIVPDEKILNLNFEYCTKLFNKKFIKNLADHYLNIVNTVLDNLNIQLSDICLLSEEEKNKILYEFNNTKMNYPKDKTIVQLFEEQVEKTPNSIALVFERQELTYKELNEKSNNLAHYLRNNGISRNDIIGIMVNRSLEMIISILAVLKSGAAYIPIDPTYPKDRIEYMLYNSNAKLLLTQHHLISSINFDKKISIDLDNSCVYSELNSNLKNINRYDDLAYIIYTSGSTGLPKGVMLKHCSLVNLASHLNNYVSFLQDTNKQHIIVSVTTVSFDIFIFETLICLQRGLKVIMCSEEEQHIPSKLLNLIEQNMAEIIQMTPSRMQIFLDNTATLSPLKYIVLAGEALPDSLLRKLLELGAEKVYNGYGPSETTVFSTFTDVTSYPKVNIGKPLANTQTYILDKYMNPCAINIPGELYISGDGVGKGYLNNDTLTKKVFLPNPFVNNSIMYKTGDGCKLLDNGEIEYLERIDNQVKIRGLRIELGEIEEKILSFQNIKKACVIKQTLNNRDFISAYFTATKKISISNLRKYLSQSLPKYMVPSYFTVLDDFTYTPNGKINKKALPLPKEILNNTEDRVYVAPKTDLELKMVSIWEMILNTSPIGITDDFFELGGDSLLAMNLYIKLRNIIDNISYADIFKYATISDLIAKTDSSDKNKEFQYMHKNYNKYSSILDLNNKIPENFNLKYINSGNLLLTGATGFLGMHILDSFLQNEDGNIYCIVRKEPGLTAQTKLHQKLNYYFGSRYDNLIGSRIIAINGDICKPGFGLSQEDLLLLANNTDIVINSAARVAHYGNYSDFYNTNVNSVKYLIDFCKKFNKKLYHVSTLSVSGNAFDISSSKQSLKEKTYFAENNLYIGQSLDNVYIRSKFEAECLVLDAILEGLDAYILRMGNLMPRLSDGIFQENILENAYINRILAFIELGIPQYLEKEYLEFTPIDSAANAIINLVTHPNRNNRIFHLFNHNHVFINTCIQDFKILNSSFKVLSDNDFKNKIEENLNNPKKKDFINYLINDLDKDLQLTYKTDITIKSDFSIKYLLATGFSWPKISEKYMTKFLDLLKEVK